MFYVYVLLCGDGKLYTGYTSNLKQRLKRHERGEVFSTKGRLPVQLAFYEAFLQKSDALRRESYLKKTAGKKALKLMLRDWFRKTENQNTSIPAKLSDSLFLSYSTI